MKLENLKALERQLKKTKKDLIIQELKEDWENIKRALLNKEIEAKTIYKYLVKKIGLRISDTYFYKVLNELLENDEEILEAKSEQKSSKTEAKKEPKKTKNQLPPELEEEKKKRMQGKIDLDELDRELGLV